MGPTPKKTRSANVPAKSVKGIESSSNLQNSGLCVPSNPFFPAKKPTGKTSQAKITFENKTSAKSATQCSFEEEEVGGKVTEGINLDNQ